MIGTKDPALWLAMYGVISGGRTSCWPRDLVAGLCAVNECLVDVERRLSYGCLVSFTRDHLYAASSSQAPRWPVVRGVLWPCVGYVHLGDAALYETHVRDYKNKFQPVGPEETHLLQSIIDTRWLLARIPGLETALLDLGRRQLLKKEPALADNPSPVLEMQARIHLQKDLRNLHLQENRLVRRREREMKELRELQAARKTAEKLQGKKADAEKNGTVFTPPVLDEFLAMLTPETRAEFMKEMQEATGETLEAAA